MPVSAISNPNLTRNALPAITMTEATSVLDKSNQYRQPLYLDDEGNLKYLNEYMSPVMNLLEEVGSGGRVVDTPIFYFTEASRLETATNLEVAISDTTGQYIKLVDPGIANVGQTIYRPFGEKMIVLERVFDNSLSGGTNVKVTRGAHNTIATTHAAGTSFLAAPQFMAEKDIPREGTGTQPGNSQWNCITMYAKSWTSTRLNNSASIVGGWGQRDTEKFFQAYALRRELGQAVIFNTRSVSDTVNGPLYIGGGFVDSIKTNVLALDTEPSRHTWESLDQFYDNLFRHDASSGGKVCLAGRDLFYGHQRIAIETARMEKVSDAYAKLGDQDYVFNTKHGPVRYVLADKDFPSNSRYGLGDVGIVIDPKNIESGTHSAFPAFTYIPDIQEKKQGVTVVEDCLLGSIWLAVRHEGTHGIFKGAPKAHTSVRSEIL